MFEHLGLGGFSGLGFMESLFREMDANKRAEYLKQIGVEKNEENLYGIPALNIDLKYYEIKVKDKLIVCSIDVPHSDTTKDYYKIDGTFLFSSEYSVTNLGNDLYLMPKEYNGQCAIYLNSEKVSDYEFHARVGSRFDTESEYTILGFQSKEAVIDKQGQIVFESKGMLDYLYLYGNILLEKDNLYDLHSGEKICEKGYTTKLETDEDIFVEVGKQVYKINKTTCEYEIFGTPPPPKEEPKQKVEVKVKKKEPKIPKQNRNNLCACGSGLKYKKCCGKR